MRLTSILFAFTAACASTPPGYSVGGVVSGLTGTGLVLGNGGEHITISGNGAFTFPAKHPTGTAYTVTVVTQPQAQSCTVASGTGTLPQSASIAVNCVAATYTVSGTISGLAQSGLVLSSAGDDLTVAANSTTFSFPPLTAGASYVVTVKAQPAGERCTVANGSGTVAADVSDVAVTCVALHLYVGSDQDAGGIYQFNLPLVSGASANCLIQFPGTTGVAVSNDGTLAAIDKDGEIKVFAPPLSAASTASATFQNGSASAGAEIAFDSHGSLFVPTQGGGAVNIFTPPFTNASTPANTINPGTASFTATFDANDRLYLTNGLSGTSNLLALDPPYTGTPVATPSLTNAGYVGLAVAGDQLLVASDNPGSIDVYDLPLTATSVKAFTITSGTSATTSLAVDSNGILYAGNLLSASVTAYSTPLSETSGPFATVPIAGTAIFGLAVGP